MGSPEITDRERTDVRTEVLGLRRLGRGGPYGTSCGREDPRSGGTDFTVEVTGGIGIKLSPLTSLFVFCGFSLFIWTNKYRTISFSQLVVMYVNRFLTL